MSSEARYSDGYASALAASFGQALASGNANLAADDHFQSYLSPSDAVRAAESQAKFFKDVDAYTIDDDAAHIHPVAQAPARMVAGKGKDWNQALVSVFGELGSYVPSRSVVMEAAFFVIARGIFNIPGVGDINLKATGALLTVAAWLQRRMLLRWHESDQIDPGLVTES